MTAAQQYRLTEKDISARKLKTIGEQRGRKLKVKDFPELPTVIWYAFGEYTIGEEEGGGEAHPRLMAHNRHPLSSRQQHYEYEGSLGNSPFS